jgi:hypothetical protein
MMQFRQFLWLLMLGLWFATSAPASASAFSSGEACGVGSVNACPFFTLPYDAPNRGGISYDGPVLRDCIYDTASVSETVTNSMAGATCLGLAPGQLLGVRGLATRQVRHLIYSSERLNTRATDILCCPDQPRKLVT